MPQNSFDIVSQVEMPEVKNAVAQANKELQTRYDLKATNSEFDLDESTPKITIRTQDEFTLKQVVDVLHEKMTRRKVPIKALEYGKMQPASGGRVTQEATQNFIALEHHSVDVPWWEDIVTGIEKPIVKDGFVKVPETPGLGVELNDEAVKAHLRDDSEFFAPTPEWDEIRSWDRIWS